MMATTLQARLDSLNISGIPFGSPNPVSHRGTFGNRDFLILFLAKHGPMVRKEIVRTWSIWRNVTTGTRQRSPWNYRTKTFKMVTIKETLTRNTKADISLGSHLNTSSSYTSANHFFKKGTVSGTWELSLDGWERADRLVSVLTSPES